MDGSRKAYALKSRPSPEQVAHLLRDQTGFIWLDGGSSRHAIFRNPVDTVSSHGSTDSLAMLQSALEASSKDALLAGYLAYELGTELENFSSEQHFSELPRLHFGIHDSALIMDQHGCWSTTGSSQFASREEDLLREAAAVSLPVMDEERPLSLGPLACDDEAFKAGIQNIVGRIHAGDLFQTNLCRHLKTSLPPESVWPLYRRMRALNPALYGAFLQLGGGQTILSNSPELFLKVRNGTIESRPIKGTRRRSETPVEDKSLRSDLLSSAKDRAELAMVVDVVRNDLSRVCSPGSVQVQEHAALMTLPTLHHTWSRITGRPNKTSVTDILRATFPPASITGAPKISAMEVAYREERRTRGPAMGAIGWISASGDMELSVAIRTAWTSAGQVNYFAGCGITADSDPDLELKESEAKALAFVTALGFATAQK